ncbi:polymorphic toxin-type HINT domain-containing protein [Streptomyces sp. NPDC093225]|uniref:polymorphic toxin-type HINT domain-containing protein n=1 Tax=Streptomyces sp. NPDC093225 TaxID=3366034 RepID=UPI00382F639E
MAEDVDDRRTNTEKTADAGAQAASLRADAGVRRTEAVSETLAHRQSVREHGLQQKAAVRAASSAKAAALAQQSAAMKGELAAAAEREKASLRAQADADVAATASATAQRLAAARAQVQDRRRSLVEAGETARTDALAAADAEGAMAVAEMEASAGACEQAGEAVAARFAGSEEPRPEQREASRRVARESAADIRAKKAAVPRELRGQAVEHGRRCVAYTRGIAAQLTEAEQTLTGELGRAGDEAQAAVRDGLAGALATVDARLRQDTAGVDSATAAARAQLDSAAAQATEELETGRAGAEGELESAAAAIGQDLGHGADETATVIEEAERPFLPGVREQVAAARATMAGSVAAARTHVGGAVAQSRDRFSAVSSAFDRAAEEMLGHVTQQQERVRDGFAEALQQVRGNRAQAAAAITEGLSLRQQGVTDAVLAQADDAMAQARGRLAEMAGQFRTSIGDAAARSVVEATRPRTDDVHTRSREAGEQAGRGVLAGLGRALVQIAVGLVVVVVVALVVAAIAAAFGVLLTAWTAVMVAGAILLAVGLVHNLVQRLGQRELEGSPGTAVLLALSDTVGITGIVEGVRGRELVTDRSLSAADRTERGVLGAVTLIGVLVGARSAIKGPPGGAFVRPVELTGGLFGRMATGVTGVAAEIASGVGRTARSVRDWLVGKGEESGGCFVSGTLVATPTGAVPVETLRIGQVVVAQDPDTGLTTAERITDVLTRTVSRVLDVAAGGHVITCSPEHPFWVGGLGWVEAGSLLPGHRLRTAAGADLRVDTVQRRPGTRWTVHNITVAGPHTYHVGAGAVLVHNKALEADFVPRQRALQGEVLELSGRATEAVRRAESLPADAPDRAESVRQARALAEEVRTLQQEVNRSSSLEDVEDLEDWQAGARARLTRLEGSLPAAPEAPPQTATQPFTPEAAMTELQENGHLRTLERDHPGRTWRGRFAERMDSEVPTQTKQKMIVTGTAPGRSPVSYEFSVVYDHPTGQFTYAGRSGGRPPTR